MGNVRKLKINFNIKTSNLIWSNLRVFISNMPPHALLPFANEIAKLTVDRFGFSAFVSRVIVQGTHVSVSLFAFGTCEFF